MLVNRTIAQTPDGKQVVESTAQEGGLLKRILDTMPETVTRPQVETLVRNLIDQCTAGMVTFDKSLHISLDEGIKKLDEMLSKQLAEILHHPKVQKLEGTLRGLHHVVSNSETCSSLKIKVLDVTKSELIRDFQRASEFDQSKTFKLIYTGEFGQAVENPTAR